VAPAVPGLYFLGVHQPQVSLVDQGGGVERLARLLVRQLLRGQPAQLVVASGNNCSAVRRSPCLMAFRIRVTSLIGCTSRHATPDASSLSMIDHAG
jgi:hypothetical protein